MENSTINNIPVKDDIQTVNNEEITAEDNENNQLILNISIDKIGSEFGDSINTDTESYSSSSSIYQMTIMEKFSFIATRILYSKYFQYYYFIVVILSVISLVLTFFLECTNSFYLLLEGFIILALIVEVVIRLLAQRKYYFYSFWNILDIIILSICMWLFSITQTQCPLNENDSIIDNFILIVRYVIQFVRLGILLKKNQTSGDIRKRKSVNFSQVRRRSTYGSFNPTSHNRREKRKDSKTGVEKVNGDVDGEDVDEIVEEDLDYQNINPYGVRYDSTDDPNIVNPYYSGSIVNESLMSPNTLSQSFVRDYTNYFIGSQGSIGFNINSNANLAKIIYHEETNNDIESKKILQNQSIHSISGDAYQKLINSNIEDNNKNSYGGLPHSKYSNDHVSSSSTLPINSSKEQSYDSLSTNPIETPTSSILSPSSKKYQMPSFPQKSFSSDVSYSITLPPKIGKKQNNVAQTNHSSTFKEIPNKINLLTPILSGSPVTYSRN
jgi:hypothetical protein